MKVKITAKHPKAEIRTLLAFAAKSVGVKHSSIGVWVKNCKRGKARGACYLGWHYITIGIGSCEDFPCANWAGRQKTIFATLQEAFISVAAHEFAHMYQYQNKRKTGEAEAHWYGWTALMEYRASLLKE